MPETSSCRASSCASVAPKARRLLPLAAGAGLRQPRQQPQLVADLHQQVLAVLGQRAARRVPIIEEMVRHRYCSLASRSDRPPCPADGSKGDSSTAARRQAHAPCGGGHGHPADAAIASGAPAGTAGTGTPGSRAGRARWGVSRLLETEVAPPRGRCQHRAGRLLRALRPPPSGRQPTEANRAQGAAFCSPCSLRAASTYLAALGLSAFQRGAFGSLAMVHTARATVRSMAAMLA